MVCKPTKALSPSLSEPLVGRTPKGVRVGRKSYRTGGGLCVSKLNVR